MIKIGKVHSLFYSDSGVQTTTKKLLLDEKGVLKDKHYDKSIERSVLITSLDSYELLKKEGIDAEYGSLGENLLIDYNPYLLDIGTKLKIGTVTLEISVHCTLCKSLSKVDNKIPKLLKNDRGVFAKVIKSGSLKEGNDIYRYDES
jgi:MOSC domain-containing protein YiiM